MSLININGIEIESTEETFINIYEGMSYAELVSIKIRERYSIDQELAIQRQRDIKAAEFEEYNRYCEECKNQAKILCGVPNG